MKLRRLKSTISLACSVVVLTAAPVAAKDKWSNLTTKNFNIISNADEGGTRKLALKLEQFHFVTPAHGCRRIRERLISQLHFKNIRTRIVSRHVERKTLFGDA